MLFFGFLLVPHPLLVVSPGLERMANALGLVAPFVLLRGHSVMNRGVLVVLGGLPVVLGRRLSALAHGLLPCRPCENPAVERLHVAGSMQNATQKADSRPLALAFRARPALCSGPR